jgi:shikimate dehydrogenase
VLGAGGAARAVIFGLRERGAKRIHVVNRTPARADELRGQFGSTVRPARWDEAVPLATAAALIVNTTSLGMAGQPQLDLDLSGFPAGAVVADLVYVPLRTPLLAAAMARGLRTADGLGMLLHQAVRGFSLWFGVTPRVTAELRALIEADLTRNKDGTPGLR